MGYEDKNGKSKPPKKAAQPGFRFINYTLTAEDSKQLAALDIEVEFPLEVLLTLVGEGYKFSLSKDDKNNTYVASLTDRVGGSPFLNACLTGRGSTGQNAIASLLYRHVYVAQEDWKVFGMTQPGVQEPFS